MNTKPLTLNLAFGLITLVVGLVLALVGKSLIAPEHVHPIGTGLIAVGLVATGVAIAGRRPSAGRSFESHTRNF